MFLKILVPQKYLWASLGSIYYICERIDVFRASATAIAILDSGAADIVIANELSVLQRLAREGFLVVSEVFDLGLLD